MSDRQPSGNGRAPTPHSVMRMLRLHVGDTEVVRILSHSYKGCLTHWYKGRGRYCPGNDTCKYHDIEAVWKGYCSAEHWDQAAQLWMPVVLEISESLDQDFWGEFARGQVWQLSYPAPQKKGKASGIRGQLWEVRPEHTFPEPYDLRPVLLSVYHVTEIKLNLANPLPRRLKVQPSQDVGPRNLVSAEQTPKPTAADIERFRQARAAREPGANGAGKT
jgi:hypothetical protein